MGTAGVLWTGLGMERRLNSALLLHPQRTGESEAVASGQPQLKHVGDAVTCFGEDHDL